MSTRRSPSWCTTCSDSARSSRAGSARPVASARDASRTCSPPWSGGDRASVGASAGWWNDVVDALAATSLCGHGTGLAAFALSVDAYFGEELTECFA